MTEIKGDEHDLSVLMLFAFRYCSNRHFTQAMLDIDSVILNNIHLLSAEFIRQMINDIEHEQKIQKINEEEQQKEKYDFFYRLKVHVNDYMNYLQKQQQNEDAQKLYNMLSDVMKACKTVKINLPTPWWRQVEDTSYLTPLLNKLREEMERRKQNGEQ